MLNRNLDFSDIFGMFLTLKYFLLINFLYNKPAKQSSVKQSRNTVMLQMFV